MPVAEPPAVSRLVVPAERLTAPLLVKLPLHSNMPVWISTVPKLLKFMGPPTVVVPALADLRNVPALSKRAPAKKVKLAAFRTSNNAPARLVWPPIQMPPAPVKRPVPPFSRVRARVTPLAPERLSVAAGRMIVRPLPLINPDVQFIKLP